MMSLLTSKRHSYLMPFSTWSYVITNGMDCERKKELHYMYEEEVDAVYLSWTELSKIYHLDLSATPFLIKYRDLFVLGCLTGFRFSDYSNIKLDELKNGMLHLVQKKTSAKSLFPCERMPTEYLLISMK